MRGIDAYALMLSQVYKQLRLVHGLQLAFLLSELQALVQPGQLLSGSRQGAAAAAGSMQHLQLPSAEACTLVLHQLLAGG